MGDISRIVNIAIALNSAGITESSFSDMFVLGEHVASTNRVIVITGTDELLDIGVPSTSKLYKAAQAAFSQIPSVPQLYIGRRQVDQVKVTVTKAAAAPYRVNLSWKDAGGNTITGSATYTGLVADTPELIAQGLVAAITDVAGAPVTAVAAGAVVTIVNAVSGTAYGVTTAGNLSMEITASTESVTDALAKCSIAQGNWYGTTITSRVEADVLQAADWVEANEKLFFTASSDAKILDSEQDNDIASLLMIKQMFRSVVIYHSQADAEFIDVAMPANLFTILPGGETYANKRLQGVSADTLQEGQAIAAHAKNASTFELIRNLALTQGGKVAAGEWIDIIRFRDWLKESMSINVLLSMVNAEGKLPYEDDGIQIIGAAMEQTLDLGVTRKGIAKPELDDAGKVVPSYTMTLPRSVNILQNDKANRRLRDVKFRARIAGAIHFTDIQGSLAYQL